VIAFRSVAEEAAMTAGNGVRRGGAICVIAGLVGVAGHGYLAVTVTSDSGEPFGYPEPVAGLSALQMALGLVPAILIVGLIALRRSRALPDTRRARFGHHGAVVALAGLAPVGGLAVTVTPSRGGPPVFGVVYAGYVVLLASCLLVVGLEAARRGRWVGWWRWLPFALGAWLVVPVLPALVAGFRPAGVAFAGWYALFAVLGLVLLRDEHLGGGTRRRVSTSARAAAVLTWIYVAGFGSTAVPVAAYLIDTGTLPDFLGLFTMFGGPLWPRVPLGAFVLALALFLLVSLLAGWAAWSLWNGSTTGAVLTLVLLPIEAAFWIAFATPLPWIAGVARLVLVIVAWRSLDRPGRRTDVELGRRRSRSADVPAGRSS
jgi:hypothetical protein